MKCFAGPSVGGACPLRAWRVEPFLPRSREVSRGVTRPGHEVTLCTPTVKTWAVCSVDSQDMPGQWPLISVITGDNVGRVTAQLCSTHPSSGVGGYRERVGQEPRHAHNNAGNIHLMLIVLCWFLSFYSRVWAFTLSPSTYQNAR